MPILDIKARPSEIPGPTSFELNATETRISRK